MIVLLLLEVLLSCEILWLTVLDPQIESISKARFDQVVAFNIRKSAKLTIVKIKRFMFLFCGN